MLGESKNHLSRVFNIKEVSSILGVSRIRILQKIKLGHFRNIRICECGKKTYLFTYLDIQENLKKGELNEKDIQKI